MSARTVVATCLLGMLMTDRGLSMQANGAVWGVVDFQDELPFTMTGPGNGLPRDLGVARGHGQCGPGNWWNFERVAPGAGNGGFRDRGFMRYTWCNYQASLAGDHSEGAGWSIPGYRFEPGGSGVPGARNWPDTFFVRFRIFVEKPITVASGGDHSLQLKWFLWHTSVFDGDQRVIAFVESGSNCGSRDAAAICLSLQRNISTEDSARVAIAAGAWHHVQLSWKHGVRGTSFVKVWLDNNDATKASAQDLDLSAIARFPGGTAEWVQDQFGYDNEIFIGNGSNEGTRFKEDFVCRLMDLEVGGAFDPEWAPPHQ